MKCIIPEISWHNRDPVLSIDIQVKKESENLYRLSTGGTDSHVLIWHMLPQNDGSFKLECVCDLTRHQKAVNAVKFSPSGEFLASGDDESTIIIWKMKTEQDAPDLDDEQVESREVWIQVKILRGHLNDIYDLSWSPDSLHLLSGSVDNTAIIWDVVRGKKTAILPEAKNFVQGVSWDPENKYVATLSSDGKCRIYNWRTHKLCASICKGRPPGAPLDTKPSRFYHDDTLKTFFRRLDWSPSGWLLATPCGVIEPVDGNGKPQCVTWLISRKHPSCPILYYPGSNQASMICRWSPIKYCLREGEKPVIGLPYRMVLAVATKSSIMIYDTQHAVPIALISNIHYTKLTDVAWSSDGLVLLASSTDGYCSVVTFAPGELGDVYIAPETAKQT